MRLVVPRSGHPVEDVRLLEMVYSLLRAHPGGDAYELVLSAGTRRVRLSNADSMVAWTPDLEQSMRSLLGARNVERVQPELATDTPASEAKTLPPQNSARPAAVAIPLAGDTIAAESATGREQDTLSFRPIDSGESPVAVLPPEAIGAGDEAEESRAWWS